MSKRQDLDRLAEFAGGKSEKNYQLIDCWVFHDGVFNADGVSAHAKHFTWIPKSTWNPYKDWNHLKLVLEALVKYEQQRLSKMHGPQSWGNMGWDHVFYGLKSRVFHKWDEPFDLGEAVCSMALIVAKSRKGSSDED